MIQAEVTLTNPSGLHARPAAQFAHTAGQFKTTVVKVVKDGRAVDAKSVISIMTLGAKQGTILTIQAEGPEEAEVVQTLVTIVENGFGERREA